MTTNIERAAEVIRRVDGNHTLGAGALAEALADAGRLMADLPEPVITHLEDVGVDLPIWETENYAVGCLPGYGITIETPSHGNPTTPEETRKVAYALLAAANYVEQEQDNE